MAVSRINEAGLNVNQYGNRRLNINGAMQIYQRGAGTYTNNNFALDRWKYTINGNDQAAGTITQVTDSPDGFANSLKLTTTTAETTWAADEYSHLSQLIEAQNLTHLAYGTSAAKQLTLSFHVKSSVTGTFSVGLYKADNTAQISNKTYTIDSANTWEKKTITFTANTLSGGAINNDNGIGFYVNWHLAAGSNYTGGGSLTDWTNYGGDTFWANGQATNALYTTNSSTWQLTGCQLEVGDTATDFEHRSYAHDLDACSRYYSREDAGSGAAYKRYGVGSWNSATHFECSVALSTPMRSTPTLETTGTASNYAIYSANAIDAVTSLALINDSDDGTFNRMVGIIMTVSSGGVSGEGGTLLANNDDDNFLAFDAEL